MEMRSGCEVVDLLGLERFVSASFNFSHDSNIVAFLIESDSVETVLRAKNEIREIIGHGKSSMHSTDTRKETWRNACICFHNPTLKYMSECPVGSFL